MLIAPGVAAPRPLAVRERKCSCISHPAYVHVSVNIFICNHLYFYKHKHEFILVEVIFCVYPYALLGKYMLKNYDKIRQSLT